MAIVRQTQGPGFLKIVAISCCVILLPILAEALGGFYFEIDKRKIPKSWGRLVTVVTHLTALDEGLVFEDERGTIRIVPVNILFGFPKSASPVRVLQIDRE